MSSAEAMLASATSPDFWLGVVACLSVLGGAWLLLPSRTKPQARAIAASKDSSCFVAQQDPKSSQSEIASGHVRFLHQRLSVPEIQQRSEAFYQLMNMRRSVRFFSRDPVPYEVVANCVLAAGTAPSGAHMQPWTFVIVQNAEKKQRIRDLVEAEEQVNYEKRMGDKWVSDVASVVSGLHGVDGKSSVSKPYLTDAPYLIVVMKQTYGLAADGGKLNHWYSTESVGIACGLLIAALHNANLVTLTSTPLGAGSQIKTLLGRPDREKVFLLMPVGFPAHNATVPYRSATDLRKPASSILVRV